MVGLSEVVQAPQLLPPLSIKNLNIFHISQISIQPIMGNAIFQTSYPRNISTIKNKHTQKKIISERQRTSLHLYVGNNMSLRNIGECCYTIDAHLVKFNVAMYILHTCNLEQSMTCNFVCHLTNASNIQIRW